MKTLAETLSSALLVLISGLLIIVITGGLVAALLTITEVITGLPVIDKVHAFFGRLV